jgi:hypothetical protein
MSALDKARLLVLVLMLAWFFSVLYAFFYMGVR